MPRARFFRPEHRQHRKIGPLSDAEYRLWCSMIMEADDAGRFICDTNQLRVQTWGYHPQVKVKTVEGAIEKLNDLGLIQTYEIEGIRYAFFPSWGEYQKPRYPTPSRLPAPALMPQGVTVIRGNATVAEALPKDSGEVQGLGEVQVQGWEKYKVGRGVGREGEPLTPTPLSSLSASETAKILEARNNGTITDDEARERLRALGKVQ